MIAVQRGEAKAVSPPCKTLMKDNLEDGWKTPGVKSRVKGFLEWDLFIQLGWYHGNCYQSLVPDMKSVAGDFLVSQRNVVIRTGGSFYDSGPKRNSGRFAR